MKNQLSWQMIYYTAANHLLLSDSLLEYWLLRYSQNDSQPALVLWTDGSWDENGAVGYAVVWKKGRSWAGRKAHMGFS